MRPQCKTYLVRRIVDAVVLLVILALLAFAGSVVRDAYVSEAGAGSDVVTVETSQERLARQLDEVDARLDELNTLLAASE